MNRLQLATLLSWAGDNGFQGRKRLQKVVYFLQEDGCPLDCRFILHYFGPYSHDVADRCDEMVAAGLVVEKSGPQNGAMQYAYTLKPEIRALLQQTRDEQMLRFQSVGKTLINQDLWTLELGSTILFFYRQGGNWDDALINACEFKKAPPDAKSSQKALALAKRFSAQAGSLQTAN